MDKFENLEVWRKAHQLTLHIYQLTKHFPSDERFGLVAQMRRSATSAPTNIAEGAERRSSKDRIHFHDIARTSLEELKYQLMLSRDLRYITAQEYAEAVEHAREVGRMLRGLDRSL